MMVGWRLFRGLDYPIYLGVSSSAMGIPLSKYNRRTYEGAFREFSPGVNILRHIPSYIIVHLRISSKTP